MLGWVGKASIARVSAGVNAVVRIPVVRGVMISHDIIKFVTVVISTQGDTIVTRTDNLTVDLNILLFSAYLINSVSPI